MALRSAVVIGRCAFALAPLGATLATAPVAAQVSEALDELPDVTFTHYNVDGADPMAIRASIDAARPTNENAGHRVDALNHWAMRWRWQGDGGGGCDLARAVVTVRGEVTLPHLAHPEALSPALLGSWHRYLTALEAHEVGHLR